MSAPAGLLESVVRDALDPSYAQAAARQALSRQGVANRRGAAGFALLALAGAFIGLAVFAQHKSVPQVSAARTALAGDAGARSRDVKQLARDLAAGQRQLAELQQQRLAASATGRSLARQEAALSAAIATTAVSGSGVTVTVSDALTSAAPAAGSRPQGHAAQRTGRVTDQDLQGVVNALWAAGARAIAVGGVRLGPATAIRTAGETILVDFKPLRSPYLVTAIGSPGLAAAARSAPALIALTGGPAGTHPLVTVDPSAALSLPAASPPPSRSARPLPGGTS
jgi:uncharacterized protein YlxW (UPF0749 family)